MSSLVDAYRSKLTASRLLQDPELLLTAPEGFGLGEATVLQRAIACLIKGWEIPDRLWVEPVIEAFGGYRPTAAGTPRMSLELWPAFAAGRR